MIKNSTVFFLLLVLFTGCASLMKSATTKLTGDWVMSGIEGESTERDESRIGKLKLIFKEDGTMITDLPGTMEYMAGTYTVDDKVLTMVIDGEPARAKIISLKKGVLLLQPLEGRKELPYTLSFEKEKPKS